MKVTLPNLTLTFSPLDDSSKNQDYLIVAGGKQPDRQLLTKLAQNRTIYCADKGISYCRQANIISHYLFGDNDSALTGDWLWAKENNVKIKHYPIDKNKTDLQIALEYILQKGNCRNLVVTGIWGGRFDHTYSGIFTLATFSKQMNCPVILTDQDETMLIVNEKQITSIDFQKKPNMISLLPLEKQVVVTLKGAKWELENTILTQDDPYAISNTLKENSTIVDISVFAGQVGFYSCFLAI